MPLPSSGPISADDLNQELGNSAGTQIDFQSAATDFGVSSAGGIGFDEFYGLSAGYNFAFSDWNGTVSITEFGVINATTGNAASVTVNTSNFGAITSTTTQTVSITVVAPSTFGGQPVDNAGSSLSGTKTATQQAVSRYLDITANDTSLVGSDTSVDLTINDIYYTDTSWTLSDSNINPSGLSIGTYEATSGTGDDTITVYLNQNTSGATRGSRFTVTANGGYPSDYVDVTQTSYTPVVAPTFTPSPTSLDWTYSQSGTGNSQTITATHTGGNTPTAVSFYLSGTHFGLVQTDSNVPLVVSGGPWVAEATNDGAGTFQVGVYPLSTNSGTSDKTENLTINMGNSSGTTSTPTVPLTQTYQATWNTNLSSLSFPSSGDTLTIVLNSSVSWTAAVSGTGYSINTTSGGSGTHNISVTKTASDLGGNGSVTFSASGQTDIVVSLSQASAPLEWYYYVNSNSTGETSTPRSLGTLSYLGESVSIGLYAYRGSTAAQTPFNLQKGNANSGYGVGTTTSNTTSPLTTVVNTGQGTGASATTLYINASSNSGNSSTRTINVELYIDGTHEVTFTATQAADPNAGSGGGGGAPKEDIV